MTHPDDVVDELKRRLQGEPVFMAGSLAAAVAHDKPSSWSDVDIFVPTEGLLFTTIKSLLMQGAVPIDYFDRVWHRWQRYGLRKWHTNSMRLETPTGVEVNVVYKLVDGHATTSLSQVLESFDFGLLAMGWELETGQYRDMRAYLFPHSPINGPLPLMPNKRDNWTQGFVSQYNGLREGSRYLKYLEYGYDMSAVADDLVTGYNMAALYHSSEFDPEKQALGTLYERIGEAIATHDIAELKGMYAVMDFKSPISEILDRLE
jgi:hypothetical protein